MKKILILIFTSFIITSCNNEGKITIETIDKIESINEGKITIETIDKIESINEGISYSDLKENLEKLEGLNVDTMEIEMLNIEIKNIFKNYIKNEVIKNNDIKLCGKLDSNEQESCKFDFVLSKTLGSGDINNCDNLLNIGLRDNCKNNILLNQANNDLNIDVCEKLIDESEEKFEINNCKNLIYIEKAKIDLDINICKKISTDMEKDMCIGIVNMEKINNK